MTSKEGTSQKSIPAKLTSTFDEEKSSSSTLKRNPKMELCRTDLLKLLSYLEGELQARDVVIATLKAERVKRLLTPGRYWIGSATDPRAALQRDAFGGVEPTFDEEHIQSLADHQMMALDNYVMHYRKMTSHMVRLMREMEERHRKVVQDLEEEKRKHEHDTAQGDDITYGLEKERTRLKQELEFEKCGRKKAEKDVKKITDLLEEEKARTKSIVLLLIAERKKALIKYVEERKRSEDLAQILAEEKGRIDAMAEGLEEESKKSLQMEAELEKQLAEFDTERQQLRAAIAKEEKKYKDMELEAERCRNEAESFKKQLVEAHQVAMFQAGAGTPGLRPPQPSTKPTIIPPQGSTSPRPSIPLAGVGLVAKGAWAGVVPTEGSVSPPPGIVLTSVAKVVQPTATVSSVPVSGPTTGIARSVSPGQGVRNVVYAPSVYGGPGSSNTVREATWTAQVPQEASTTAQVVIGKTPGGSQQVVQVTPRVSLQTTAGAKVYATAQGSKVTFHMTANATDVPPQGQASLKKPGVAGRGFPPPIPPNKPTIPPKKDAIRRVEAEKAETAAKFNASAREKSHCPEVREEDTARHESQERCT